MADLVYVEEVEWGLTRLLALYSTELPPVISPVRSARISDLGILAPFGRVAFAYSGAQAKLDPLLRRANLVNLPERKFSDAWSVESWRPVSWNNHALNPRLLLEQVNDVQVARDIGLRFGASVPAGGKPVESMSTEWENASIGFVWDPSRRGFRIDFDGQQSQASEGGPQVATTVVFQHVKQTNSDYGDRYGGKTPLVETVGSGKAWVARNGKMWEAAWERPDRASGTRFLQADGQPMLFAPGQVWIVLLDRERTVTVS